jgi:cysteine desulfurase/selenocysteine lyase
MSDLTPDLVAAVASRLYNESPSGPGILGMDQTLSAPVEPAAESTFREQLQAPSFPVPTDGIPVSASPVLTSQRPVAPIAEAGGREGFRVPTQFGDVSSGFPATAATESQSDGLRAFVQSIRGADYRSATEAFPNEKPISKTSVNQGPARSQGALPRASDSVTYARDDRTNGYGARPLDVDAIRQDFPILHQRVHGRPLIWLDNAATTQKPQSVIDKLSHFYEHDNSNIHRAAHTLAARATDAFEQARDKVRDFLGASSSKEIVFVRGTTEAINLVAQTWGRKFLQPADEIILSTLEHHANIVPWQLVAKETGARLRVIPVNDRGEIILEEYQSLLGPRTKLVALAHASNSLGTLLPVAEMTQMAKRFGARVLIDGAQTVAHVPVNVQQLGSDFYAFSGHKIFGPTGIGVLHAREELLEIMPPWQGGGSMIKNVTFEETTYADPPAKFEAGTPNIADAVGLGAALDYVTQFGLPNIAKYEHELLDYATEQLSRINGLRLIGTAREKVGVISFVLKDRKTEEVGRMLDLDGIAVRAGHHCSQPSLRRFGVETTVRPSLAFYNTVGEIDRLADAIRRIQRR